MRNNERGFGIAVLLIAVIVLGGAGATGWYVMSKQDKQSANSVQEQSETSQKDTKSGNQKAAGYQEELATTILNPVTAEEFGDFGNVAAGQAVQNANIPTKLGDKVDTQRYQGIVFGTDDSYRILVGKLADKSVGTFELTDAFELVRNGNESSLRVAAPNVVAIDSRTVIKWANLPDTNQMVKALLEYKKFNTGQ